jgi:ribonuclease HI
MTAHAGRPLIAIFADESCLGNGREGSNPGAAGGVIEYMNRDTGRVARWDYWVSEPATTNNRMALRSAIEAFRIISRKGVLFRVVFTTDSQYLVKGMTEWVHGWMARGWRRKDGAVENVELWREAVGAVAPHEVAWRWVRGRESSGHPGGATADEFGRAGDLHLRRVAGCRARPWQDEDRS